MINPNTKKTLLIGAVIIVFLITVQYSPWTAEEMGRAAPIIIIGIIGLIQGYKLARRPKKTIAKPSRSA